MEVNDVVRELRSKYVVIGPAREDDGLYPCVRFDKRAGMVAEVRWFAEKDLQQSGTDVLQEEEEETKPMTLVQASAIHSLMKYGVGSVKPHRSKDGLYVKRFALVEDGPVGPAFGIGFSDRSFVTLVGGQKS